MALEVRYIPMVDEADDNNPKIFRVVYKEGAAISYSASDYKEAAAASDTVVGEYFDLLKEYFNNLATYVDTKTEFDVDIYYRMAALRGFVGFFFNNFDYKIIDDFDASNNNE